LVDGSPHPATHCRLVGRHGPRRRVPDRCRPTSGRLPEHQTRHARRVTNRPPSWIRTAGASARRSVKKRSAASRQGAAWRFSYVTRRPCSRST